MKKTIFVFAVIFIFLAYFCQFAESISFGNRQISLFTLAFSKGVIALSAIILIRYLVKKHFGFLPKNYARLTYLVFSLYLAGVCLSLLLPHSTDAFLRFLNHAPLFLVFVPVIEIALYVRRMLLASGEYLTADELYAKIKTLF